MYSVKSVKSNDTKANVKTRRLEIDRFTHS